MIGGSACAVAISPYQFLVIGGSDLIGSGPDEGYGQVLKFEEQAWAVWPPLSKRWVGHACVKLGNKIIISGGVDDNGIAIPTTTILNISTRKERRGGDMTMGHWDGLALVWLSWKTSCVHLVAAGRW